MAASRLDNLTPAPVFFFCFPACLAGPAADSPSDRRPPKSGLPVEFPPGARYPAAPVRRRSANLSLGNLMFSELFSVLREPWIVAAVCAILMLAAWLFAFGFHDRRLRAGEAREPGSTLIDEACLAILGLLLAFTFAAAYTKHDARNSRVADDANALRTFHLRAQSLPDPWRASLAPLARESVQQRIAIQDAVLTPAEMARVDADVSATEARMLDVVQKMNSDKDASQFAGPVSDALIQLVATHEMRVATARDSVPFPVIILLLLVAGISAFLLGRSQAHAGRRRATTFTLILLVAAIVFVTLDLESPFRGLIKTDQTPINRLAASLGIKK